MTLALGAWYTSEAMSTRKPPPTERVRPPVLSYWPANALSVREAAKKWGVSPWMVRVWVQQGRVRAAYGASGGNLWLAILQTERPRRMVPQIVYAPSGPAPATQEPQRSIAELTPRGPVVRTDKPVRPPTTGPAVDPMDLDVFAPRRDAPPAQASAQEAAPAEPVKRSNRGGRREGAGRLPADFPTEPIAREIAKTARSRKKAPTAAPVAPVVPPPVERTMTLAPPPRPSVDDLNPFGD